MPEITREDVIVRVISLKQSQDRREAMERTLVGFPLEWRFFDAYRGDTPSPLKIDPARQVAAMGRPLTPPEIGCTKSHYHVLDAFRDAPEAKWLLVFEDDLLVDCEFDYLGFINLIERRGLGFAKLFTKFFRAGRIVDWFGAYQLVRLGKDPFGAQGYLIRRDAAMRLQERITHVDRPMDDEHARFWDGGFPIHTIHPFPIIERAVPSTQETERRGAIVETDIDASGRSLARWKDAAARRWANLKFFAAHLFNRAPGGPS